MTKRGYIGGSLLAVALAVGMLVWLYRRKPGTIIETVETYFFETKVPIDSPNLVETDMQRLIRESNAAIAADDAAEKL
jgi:hypothetical protein